MRCDTVWIDAERSHLVLTWRGVLDLATVQPDANLVVVSEPAGARMRVEDVIRALGTRGAFHREEVPLDKLTPKVRARPKAMRTLPGNGLVQLRKAIEYTVSQWGINPLIGKLYFTFYRSFITGLTNAGSPKINIVMQGPLLDHIGKNRFVTATLINDLLHVIAFEVGWDTSKISQILIECLYQLG